jgi:hypothetical protein
MARRFEKANGFRVKVALLIFTDNNTRQWVRENDGYFGEALRLFHTPTVYVGPAPVHLQVRNVACS